MTQTKKLYLFSIIALFLIPFLKSYACDLESDTRAPHISRYSVTGAKEFAEILEDSFLRLQGPFLLLSDVDGVVTDLSEPNRSRTSSISSIENSGSEEELSYTSSNLDDDLSEEVEPYASDSDEYVSIEEEERSRSLAKPLGLMQEPRSRGCIVPYLQTLRARGIPIIFSSAWDKPDQTEARLCYLNLLEKQIERLEGIQKIESVIQHPPVTEKEREDAETDPEWLQYLENRPSEEKIEYIFNFVQKGHCISVKYGSETYYSRKAFAPDVLFRNTPDALKEIKTLVFMEDSERRISEFLDQLPLASYYSTLENVIIFEFPHISGQIRPEDTIAPEYLVPSSKIEKKEKL